MPTYEYACSACGNHFEEFQSITAKPIKKCPKCGKLKVKRLISAGAGFIFKGSGFYTTDYRSDSYKESAKGDVSKTDAAKTDSPKTDAAAATKTESKPDSNGKPATAKTETAAPAPAKTESKPAGGGAPKPEPKASSSAAKKAGK